MNTSEPMFREVVRVARHIQTAAKAAGDSPEGREQAKQLIVALTEISRGAQSFSWIMAELLKMHARETPLEDLRGSVEEMLSLALQFQDIYFGPPSPEERVSLALEILKQLKAGEHRGD